MVDAKVLDGSSSPRAFFGAELRRLREAAELSQARLAKLVFVSPDFVAKVEKATRFPVDEEIPQRLDAALGTDGHLLRLFHLAKRKSGVPDHFTTYVELERTAVRIEEYQGQAIPGLLQTPSYARVLFRSGSVYRTEEAVEGLLAVRLERQRLLEGQAQYWAIIAEQLLHEPGVDSRVMRGQLEHLLTLAREHRIALQVLPRAAGLHPLRYGPLTLLSLPDGSRVAYADATLGGNLWDDPRDVAKCVLLYDQARAAALPSGASLAVLEAALKECDA